MLARYFPSSATGHTYVHSTAFVAIGFAIFAALVRLLATEGDSVRCNNLLETGSWLDAGVSNWQPEGCTPHTYAHGDFLPCLASRHVVFIGDMVTKSLFFQFANLIESASLSQVKDHGNATDAVIVTNTGTQVSFFWDPYLNSTRTTSFTSIEEGTRSPLDRYPYRQLRRPSLLVLGTGVEYLLDPLASGGLPAWEAAIELTLNTISQSPTLPADRVMMLPVLNALPLPEGDSQAIRQSDVDAMNSDIFYRVHQAKTLPAPSVIFAKVLSLMLATSSGRELNATASAQAEIMLNYHCNGKLPLHSIPTNTCCSKGAPLPKLLQLLVLIVVVLCGPGLWYISSKESTENPSMHIRYISAVVFGAVVGAIYTADRTMFWVTGNRQFSIWTWTFLVLACVVIGLSTLKRFDDEPVILHSRQIDEWKGWMQAFILVSNYLNASKSDIITNSARLMISAYLFLLAFRHTSHYLNKNNYSLQRCVQVLVRLNLLTFTLSYTMDTSYMSYLFAPLFSAWFIVIHLTMAIGGRFNQTVWFVFLKIILSATGVALFTIPRRPIQSLFKILGSVFAIHWSAVEWRTQMNLDLWIVFVGMATAVLVAKTSQHKITQHPQWSLLVKLVVGLAVLALPIYIALEFRYMRHSNYDFLHPSRSAIPILSFLAIRNATPTLRSTSSWALSLLGSCSLETFIIHRHLWLAGDGQGVLMFLPQTRWRPLNFLLTTIVSLYVSYHVSQATRELTGWICDTTDEEAARHVESIFDADKIDSHEHDNEIDLERIPLSTYAQLVMNGQVVPESPPPQSLTARFSGWVRAHAQRDKYVYSLQRLAHDTAHRKWSWGMKSRLFLIFWVLWLLNLLWTYP